MFGVSLILKNLGETEQNWVPVVVLSGFLFCSGSLELPFSYLPFIPNWDVILDSLLG